MIWQTSLRDVGGIWLKPLALPSRDRYAVQALGLLGVGLAALRWLRRVSGSLEGVAKITEHQITARKRIE
jgi:hypothetical protein